MPDEYALLRWETEGGASDEPEPLQAETVEQEEAVHVDHTERLGPPTRQPPTAPGGARSLAVRLG